MYQVQRRAHQDWVDLVRGEHRRVDDAKRHAGRASKVFGSTRVIDLSSKAGPIVFTTN